MRFSVVENQEGNLSLPGVLVLPGLAEYRRWSISD